MEGRKIPTIAVNGFLGAGKTGYIQDCLKNDFFYKRGKTLILTCEEGEEEYDPALLAEKNTVLRCFEGGDFPAFVRQALAETMPDRVYLERNVMKPVELADCAELLRVDFVLTLIEGSTLPVYLNNLRAQLQKMVSESHQVIFNRCAREVLAPHRDVFRMMNAKAVFLWEGPTGYHEKAFGVTVPFDLTAPELTLAETDFAPFYLDALAAPEHYEGKRLRLLAQLRRDEQGPGLRAGRQVMTCCLADTQFCGFPCEFAAGEGAAFANAWVRLTAQAEVRLDRYRQKRLALRAIELCPAQPPEHWIIGL